jgi:hypothetical protein
MTTMTTTTTTPQQELAVLWEERLAVAREHESELMKFMDTLTEHGKDRAIMSTKERSFTDSTLFLPTCNLTTSDHLDNFSVTMEPLIDAYIQHMRNSPHFKSDITARQVLLNWSIDVFHLSSSTAVNYWEAVHKPYPNADMAARGVFVGGPRSCIAAFADCFPSIAAGRHYKPEEYTTVTVVFLGECDFAYTTTEGGEGVAYRVAATPECPDTPECPGTPDPECPGTPEWTPRGRPYDDIMFETTPTEASLDSA